MRISFLSLCLLIPALVCAQAFPFPSDSPSFNQVSPPPVPQLDWEGHSITACLSNTLPSNERLEDLTRDPGLLAQISEAEYLPTHMYWHQGDQGSYCHFVDFQGNDWYGWQADTRFQWVYAYEGKVWAQEPMDGRWLCYSKANWWWKSDEGSSAWCLYRAGTYFMCDANGKITDSKGNRPGELKSDYEGPFQGDFMSRQVFVPGPRGSTGGFHGGGHGPWPGHHGGNRVIFSQTVAWNGR